MAPTPPEWLRSPRTILPGLTACLALAGGGFLLQMGFEKVFHFLLLEALVIALIGGMAWRHFAGTASKPLLPGAKFAAKELLEFAIVILGCSVDFNLIFKSGPLLIGTACALVVTVISMATFLGQRLGLNRKTSVLIGVGNGICGNSAIAAVAPLIEAESADVAASIGFTAIASVVLVLLLPLLPRVIPLSFTQYGVVAGLTVYAVPQVLAAAYPVSAESVAIATLAKLTRVLFLSPVVMFFAIFGKSKGSREKFSLKKLFPWFLVGFFFFAGLRTLEIINLIWADRMRDIGKVCTMLAMGGIGLSVDLRALKGSSRKVIMTVGITLLFMVLFAVVFAKNAFASELLLEHSSRPLQAESSMEALEPWETPISGFFVRSHFDIPVVDASSWRLTIDGLVDRPISISLRDLMRLPAVTFHSVLECSGNGRGLQQPAVPGVQWRRGAVGNAAWTGVSVNELLRRAGVKSTAKFATLKGMDKPAKASVPGFIRSIPIEKLTKSDTILAWSMNREPLPVLHGGPLRIVLPNWYGENWIKWINHITLSAAEDEGFYMKKGYRVPKSPVKPGEPWDSATGVPVEQILVQSLIVAPIGGSIVKPGPILVKGKAFSGAGTITKVEVSGDDGKTWGLASLSAPHQSGGWQEFTYDFVAVPDSVIRISSRATDSTGAVQPQEHTWNPPGYLRNAVDLVEIRSAPEGAKDGARLVEERCLTCHARALIDSQRLTESQWQKVVGKMKGFGVELTPTEERQLASYLSRPPAGPAHLRASNFDRQVAEHTPELPKNGSPARGKQTFAAKCAVCHGDSGEGGRGPKLRNNSLSRHEFSLTVRFGKRDMPAFGAQVSERDQTDIQAFLHRG